MSVDFAMLALAFLAGGIVVLVGLCVGVAGRRRPRRSGFTVGHADTSPAGDVASEFAAGWAPESLFGQRVCQACGTANHDRRVRCRECRQWLPDFDEGRQ